MKISKLRRAFTLVEIMVAMSIMVMIMAVLLRTFLEVLNTYKYDTAKILINHDIRRFTASMTEDATYSNYFKIFPAYGNLTRSVTTLVNPSDPDQGYTTALTDSSVADGQTGDCLVLVYKDTSDDTKIARIICYFRNPGPTVNGVQQPGPVRRFDLPITPSSSLPVWQLIPDIPDPTIYPVVVELSQDIGNGLLFYDFQDRAIIINGQIVQRGGALNTVHFNATNTYNFTVAPRG
jgi:prepilin-type N-terminal cleavage/methylation domain-containing protein